MNVSDFDFDLPKNLLAEYPAQQRDHSRLMLVDRKKETISHHFFYDIPSFFDSDDLLIRNNVKVKANRYLCRKNHPKGARLEVLLIQQINPNRWQAFIDPLKKVQIGTRIIFKDQELVAEIESIKDQRTAFLHFIQPIDFSRLDDLLRQNGLMPIPRYIQRKPEPFDHERYQTIYAKEESGLAAPTSGLHFTPKLFDNLLEKGVTINDLTLDIGLGTFNPVYAEAISDHVMHKEGFFIPSETAQAINSHLQLKKRIVALGTTSIRSMESAYEKKQLNAGPFETDIFIYPPYKFNVAGALITNFHTPKSTLLMLVCAFGGYSLIMKAYEEAVRSNYRFYSYGDAMMII